MRKGDSTAVGARKMPGATRDEASIRLVCLALLLSLAMLGCRILSIW
jgi:hypothetical protein